MTKLEEYLDKLNVNNIESLERKINQFSPVKIHLHYFDNKRNEVIKLNYRSLERRISLNKIEGVSFFRGLIKAFIYECCEDVHNGVLQIQQKMEKE